MSIDLRILVAIADFYTANYYKNTMKSGLVPVINQAVAKLRDLTDTSGEHLDLLIQFIIKVINVTFTAQYRPS